MVTWKRPLVVAPIWATAPTASESEVESLRVPSLAVMVTGYDAAAAAAAEKSTLPPFVAPGECTVAETPAGTPDTVRVTLPVDPSRMTAIFTVAPDCPGKMRAEAGETDTDKLGGGAELPPPPQAANPSRHEHR